MPFLRFMDAKPIKLLITLPVLGSPWYKEASGSTGYG